MKLLGVVVVGMPTARDSLGGQNNPGRRSGARSSRALSTKLFRQLRELDRKISEIDNTLERITGSRKPSLFWGAYAHDMWKRRETLNQKRAEVRFKRKQQAE